MRDVSLSAQKFEDFSDDRAAPSRRAKAPFPPDFGPARPQKERPALARFLRGPRLGVVVLTGIAGLALIGVPMNALFLQDGRHPAPLFGARVLTPEPIETATKAPPAPAQHPARVEAARADNAIKTDPAPRAKPAKPQASSDAGALAAEILKSEAPAPAAPAKPAKKREAVPNHDAIGALLGGAKPAPPPAAPRPASAGPDQNVLSAERALQRLGYVVKPDGVMTPELRKTIEKFEHDNGLPPTGQLGPKVVKLLSARTGPQR